MPCDFNRLVRYLDRQLNLDRQLQLLLHLDNCQTCFDTLYQLIRDRDEALYLQPPQTRRAG